MKTSDFTSKHFKYFLIVLDVTSVSISFLLLFYISDLEWPWFCLFNTQMLYSLYLRFDIVDSVYVCFDLEFYHCWVPTINPFHCSTFNGHGLLNLPFVVFGCVQHSCLIGCLIWWYYCVMILLPAVMLVVKGHCIHTTQQHAFRIFSR